MEDKNRFNNDLRDVNKILEIEIDDLRKVLWVL